MGTYDEHYGRMESSLTALASSYSTLLDKNNTEEFSELINAREYGLAYEVIAAAFSRHPSLVKKTDLDLLRNLGKAMHVEGVT